MESIPESQSQLSLVSFQLPVPDDFSEGDLVADLSGLALVDVGVTDGDVSGSPTMSLATIEEFWMQFHMITVKVSMLASLILIPALIMVSIRICSLLPQSESLLLSGCSIVLRVKITRLGLRFVETGNTL
jgi:hypothetical protein